MVPPLALYTTVKSPFRLLIDFLLRTVQQVNHILGWPTFSLLITTFILPFLWTPPIE